MSWKIDPAHSHIQFTIRHMMISKVRGHFEDFSGVIEFDENNPAASKIDVEIRAASINTREPQRDGHLRSPDFFDVAKYPVMTFKSSRVQKVDSSHGRIIGNLTIKNVTKEVVLEVEYAGLSRSPWGAVSAGASATTTINRKDWGLTWNQALETGGVLVGDEIKIDIEIEIVKQEEAVLEAVA